MAEMEFGVLLAQICAWAAIIAVAGFVACYNLAARWWSTPEGQNVMLLSVVVVTFAMVGQLTRYGVIPMTVAPYVSACLWVAVTVTYIWRTILMLKAQGFWRSSERRTQFDKGPADQG